MDYRKIWRRLAIRIRWGIRVRWGVRFRWSSILHLAEIIFFIALCGIIGVGLWVRYSLGVIAIDGTEECGACHIMKPYVEDLRASLHYGEARCDDCHVPHDNPAVFYAYKVQAGIDNVTSMAKLYRDGTLDSFKPKATPETLQIIVENCWRCHDDTSEALNEGVALTAPHSDNKPDIRGVNLNIGQFTLNPAMNSVNCLDCHTGLIHDRQYRTPDQSKRPENAPNFSEPFPASSYAR